MPLTGGPPAPGARSQERQERQPGKQLGTRNTAVDEDIYFRDKRNSVGLKSADECHFTSSEGAPKETGKTSRTHTSDNDEDRTPQWVRERRGKRVRGKGARKVLKKTPKS